MNLFKEANGGPKSFYIIAKKVFIGISPYMKIVFPLESPFMGEIMPFRLFDWFLFVLTEKTFIEIIPHYS